MELGSSEAELDPADARQALSLGSSSSGSGGGGGGGPGSHAIVAAAAPLARLALTCHVAYHLSYRVPVLFFEVGSWHAALRLLCRPARLLQLQSVRSQTAKLPACCKLQNQGPCCMCPPRDPFVAQAAGLDGAPLGLDTLLAALPRLREAVCGGQPGTVVTQEVRTEQG